MQFQCDVYDAQGVKQRVIKSADSRDELVTNLLAANFSIVDIKPLKSTHGGLFQRSKFSLDDLEFFAAQLSMLLGNGLKLEESLALLNKTATQPHVKFTVSNILAKVRQGDALSQALEPKFGFDPLFVNLVALGESSGSLNEVFKGVAADLKFKKDLRGKVSQALAYPMLILVFCISAILFVFNVVIPRMAVLFDSHSDLPWYTQAMLGLAEFVQIYQWFILPALLALVVIVIHVKKMPQIKAHLDVFLLRVPVAGAFITMLERIQFASSLSLTLKNGLPLEKALFFSGNVVTNQLLKQQISRATQKVREGSAMSEAFSNTLVFDDFHTGLIEVGERTADLGAIFEELTRREQEAFEQRVNKFTTLLEPVLILLMAGIVGGVVVVMLMSIIAIQDVSF